MNLFGSVADELTELIELIDASPLRDQAVALQRSLQHAYVQACLADRSAERLTRRQTVSPGKPTTGHDNVVTLVARSSPGR